MKMYIRGDFIIVFNPLSKRDEVYLVTANINIPITYRDNKESKEHKDMIAYLAESQRGVVNIIDGKRAKRKATKKEIEIYKQMIVESNL